MIQIGNSFQQKIRFTLAKRIQFYILKPKIVQAYKWITSP